MSGYILRLFPSYRRLLASAEDRLRLQDQIASLQGENAWLREQFTKAHDTERDAYKLMVNAAWQIQYGMKPYPEAPGLPDRLTERSEPGSIKREDHWLTMRANGEKQSREALENYFRICKLKQQQAQEAGQVEQ